MMPGVNGLDLLKFIRHASPYTVVVMMTAHSSVDTAIQALNEGAFAYLRKPVEAAELRSAMANAFEKYSLEEQNRNTIEALATENEYNEQVLQHLVYTVVATDTNGNIRKVNKAMEDLLGYSEKELMGQPLGKILSPVNEKSVWNDLQSSRTVSGLALVFRAKNGADIQVLFTGTIMRDESGAIVGFLGTANRPAKGEEDA
jgi:PAS domain S-box-containing protein